MSASATEIGRQFIRAWNADQRHLVDEWAAPTLTVDYPHFPEPLRGPAAFKEMLARTHQFFPDLTIEVHAVVGGGPQVAVRWTYRGTFREGEMFGVAADGQSVSTTGMTMYRVEEGRVQEARGVVDNFGLMTQLGAEPRLSDEG